MFKLIDRIKKQRGVALLLALMMVTLILLLVLFVSALGVGQLKFAGSSSDSSRAFSAADAGIEYALSQINLGLKVGDSLTCGCGSGSWCPAGGLSGNTQYCLTADNTSSPRKITAVGRTNDTNIRRSLEVLVPAYAAMNTMGTICTSGVTSLALNTVCTAAGWSGATGMVGAGVGACNTTSFPNAQLGRTDVTMTAISGNYYVIQCYK